MAAALILRRSRGHVPRAIALPVPAGPHLLACGAELKSTFCLAKGRRAWVSHHIGDLRNYETLRSFSDGIVHFQRMFAVEPELVMCLGATAAQALLGPNFRVTQDRGRILRSPLAPRVLATVHFSFILCAEDEETREYELQRFIADLTFASKAIRDGWRDSGPGFDGGATIERGG